jgi:hypothetical protein
VTLTAADDSGDTVTVPVYNSGASASFLPVSTELIVLGVTIFGVHTAISLA